MTKRARFQPNASADERVARERMAKLLSDSPLPSEELPSQLLLYARRQVVTDVLVTEWLYKQVLEIPGVLMELGCRYGSRLALFASMRGILEPYNAHRRIIGFDSFRGFVDSEALDGDSPRIRAGAFATPDGYAVHLRDVLATHEQESPLSHMSRCEVIEGDIRQSLPSWLDVNPETFVALAYFDLDLYAPTASSIRALIPRLVRGSVLAFDEVAHPEWPGETAALVETLGLHDRPLRRPPGLAAPTVIVW